MTRPSWDEYFMEMAISASRRATCPRKSVGCVLVRDRAVLETGYNGSPPGKPHCTDVGCEIEPDGKQLHENISTALSVYCEDGDWWDPIERASQKTIKHCTRTIHAEVNAVAQAAKQGQSTDGATAYITCEPCYACSKILLSAGVTRVVFKEPYGENPLKDSFDKYASIQDG